MTPPANTAQEASRSPILLQDWSRSGQWCEAIFLERPHRYAIRAYLPDLGQEVVAHLGDPGRLHDLLQPGARLLLDGPFPPSERKTSYTATLVEAPSGVWVSLVTTLPNKLFRLMLQQGHLPHLWAPEQTRPNVRSEVRHHNSRFDFQLSWPSEKRSLWLEIKSASWVEGTQALFPDAPTQRGTRHVRELTELHQQGEPAHIMFVVQRPDATEITPAQHIDPEFASALQDAQDAGLGLSAVCIAPTPEDIRFVRRLPIIL